MKLDLHECAAAVDVGFKRKQKETCGEAQVQQTTDSSQVKKEKISGGTPEVRYDRRMYVNLIQFLAAPPGDKKPN